MCDGPLNLTALKERIVKEAAAGIARARANGRTDGDRS
jgi:hypothetical protein